MCRCFERLPSVATVPASHARNTVCDVFEVPERPQRSAVAIVSAAVVVLVVGAVVVVATGAAGDAYRSVFAESGRCGEAPVVLDWGEAVDGYRRSEPFVVESASSVAVDVTLADDDGGVLQFGKSVWAVPVESPLVVDGRIQGVHVGHGREAVNERVALDAGSWQIVIKGRSGVPEVRVGC